MDGGAEGGEPMKQPDTIFIQGLGPDITQDQLKEHFGTAGPIKVRPILNIILHNFYILGYFKIRDFKEFLYT